MGLQRVWIETLDHGLVRADHVVEVLAHKTAPFAGKPAHWLLDVVTATNQGAGSAQAWTLTPSHRTLIQTDRPPHGAAARLAGLLAALHSADSAGLITTRATVDDSGHGNLTVDFCFQLFPPPPAPDALIPTRAAGSSPSPLEDTRHDRVDRTG
ncbi:hypothetical protein [Actinomycetospora sp. TBRC 11914]|uniref:hypothetical protein n=1 Tax=Actinomycetospora sp. TBRC 11914 TaxID=2729387 RepID=UPI00145FBE21|nr:hypothetical protein [Actinomycetospora sp. TBRC 11914]NMO88284.1 hypothetical protein [Actinomycetospora sp. TBRC 11914]